MKQLFIKLSFLTLLGFSIISCKDDEACTTEFKSITVVIQDFDGTPATLDDLWLIRQSDNDTTSITNNGGDVFTLVDDNTPLGEADQFMLRGYQAGNLVLSEPYTFGRDECHIMKIAGKSKITLD